MSARNHFHAVHYRLIANAIAGLPSNLGHPHGDVAEEAVVAVIDALADLFEEDNPRFDRDRFEAAADGAPTNRRDQIDPPQSVEIDPPQSVERGAIIVYDFKGAPIKRYTLTNSGLRDLSELHIPAGRCECGRPLGHD